MNDAGKAWVFGDNIDTDVLAPGLYMKGPLETLAQHCLEAVDPEFARNVQPGDVVVGATNFGIGSSREQAVEVLKLLGVRTLIAKSFAGIFFRNALNFGVVALTCDEADRISAGDRIAADPARGVIDNLSTGESYACDPLPGHLLEMVTDGGLVPHLEKRLAKEDAIQ
ncbi:MAG: 3-isopropylmalate dehydratase small subunit [Methyloligellaceae bacterium]